MWTCSYCRGPYGGQPPRDDSWARHQAKLTKALNEKREKLVAEIKAHFRTE